MKLDPKHRKATEYCLFCPRLCRFACPVASAEARETTTPWGLMSLAAMVRRGSVKLDAEVAEVFYHCVSCRRCQAFCKHDNDVPGALAAVRAHAVDAGIPVPRGIQGLDMRFDQHGSPHGEVPALPDEVTDAFAADAQIAFMPGCARRAKDVDSLAVVGQVLESLLGEKVELIQQAGKDSAHCCGESLRTAGFPDRADRHQKALIKDLRGRKMLITGCGHFRARAPQIPGRGKMRILHISEVLAEAAPRLAAETSGREPASAKVIYHDSCSVGRGFDGYRGPRDVLRALLGKEVEEFWQHKEEAQCCGGGTLYADINPEAATIAATDFARTVDDHEAEIMVTPEFRCKLHMRERTDVRVMDLVDIAAARLGVTEPPGGLQ